ncbi:MAG: hypothetical protein K8R60_19485 [Burkholderiales bacterium]|nr:hypothetical protein [Burkholderiales bacterium]
MHRSLVLAAAAAATLFTATAANAGHVNWSVGINLPLAPVVSSGPAYYPAPAYYGAPVYGAPTYYPEATYYAPSYYPAPVVYAPRVYAPRPRVWLPAPPPLPRFGAPWRGQAWRGGHDQQHHGNGNGNRVDWRR